MKNTITLKLLILSLFTFLSLQGITQAWEYMEPMPTARALTTASELDGKIYVIGGTFSKTSPATAVVEVYDPITNTWDTTAPDLPVPLCGASSCVVDGKIYVIGGRTAYNGPPVQSVYFYDPIKNIFGSVKVLFLDLKYKINFV